MGRLTDRRVLISGGTAGIGYATAARLAAEGAQAFILGRNSAALETARAELGVPGCSCDVRDFDACEAAVATAAAAMGGIDALVNCAGVGAITPFEALAPDVWRSMIDTNLTGTFNTCKAALPWLIRSPRGDIVNLGSRAGRYAFPGGTAYCASKAAIQAFSEALFLDVAKHAIAVSLISPGTVATGFAGVESESWQLAPEDVATVVADCLASHRRANLNWIEMRPSRRDG